MWAEALANDLKIQRTTAAALHAAEDALAVACRRLRCPRCSWGERVVMPCRCRACHVRPSPGFSLRSRSGHSVHFGIPPQANADERAKTSAASKKRVRLQAAVKAAEKALAKAEKEVVISDRESDQARP